MAGTGEIPAAGGFGDIQSILDAFKSIFGGSNTQSVDASSPVALQGIQQLLSVLLPQISSGDYSREAAVTDSQGEVDDIIRQMKEGGLPQIFNQAQNTGAYNSTTAGLLQNDLTARTAAQAALVRSKNIESYSRISQNQVTQLIALLNAATNAQRLTNTTNTQQGLKDNPAARNTALAAALAALAKGNKGGGTGGKSPEGKQAGNTKVPNAPTKPPGEPDENDESKGLDMKNPYSDQERDPLHGGDDASDESAGLDMTNVQNASDESFGLDMSAPDTSIFDSSSPDFMALGDLSSDLPDMLNADDLMFFGSDGQDNTDFTDTTDNTDNTDITDTGDTSDAGNVDDGGGDPFDE